MIYLGQETHAGSAHVILVPATAENVALFWDMRNDPAMRRNSFNQQKKISFTDYCDWFYRTLKLKLRNRRLFTAVNENGIPVGIGRLDAYDGKVELALTVCPLWRGLGYGRLIAAALSIRAKTIWPKRKQVAFIRANNTASLRACLKAGFSLKGGRCLTLELYPTP